MLANHKPLRAGFFRSIGSTELLQQFFDKYGAWEALKLKAKPKTDEIWEAWETLTHPQKARMGEALSQINDIGRDEGHELLLHVAEEAKVPNFRDLTPQKLAMIMRLNYKTHFAHAYDYFNLEQVENLKEFIGKEPVPCNPSPEDKERFKAKLRVDLAKASHGEGLRIDEGPHLNGKWVLVIPHEQHAKPDYEFAKDKPGEIRTRDRRPLYDMVLIYCPADGCLKIKSGKGQGKAEICAATFATEILHRSANHFSNNETITFSPLQLEGFDFPKQPGDEFETAAPTFIEFQKLSGGCWYTVRCTRTRNGRDSALTELASMGIPVNSIKIKRLWVEFRFPGDGRKNKSTAKLSLPNKTNLTETARDNHINDILKRWGFKNASTN